MDIEKRVTETLKHTIGEQAFQLVVLTAQLQAAQEKIAELEKPKEK